MFRRNEKGETLLHIASVEDNVGLVEQLIKEVCTGGVAFSIHGMCMCLHVCMCMYVCYVMCLCDVCVMCVVCVCCVCDVCCV